MIRVKPVIAVAHRDLRCELSAKQRGWILIAITGLLLLPIASVDEAVWQGEESKLLLTGQVPSRVIDTPGVEVVEGPAHIVFYESTDGALISDGHPPPLPLRDALNQGERDLKWIDVSPKRELPKRSLLFALISASVLTGALSESISGERSQRTLQALLAASITRLELIFGKWLAWAGYGALAATLAALVSLFVGTTNLGWWLLPLPIVPATTVALGLFMVRHATDRVAGATISLRILPALLAILALCAWFLGGIHPLLGASVPLGGALIATGQVWTGLFPHLVASLSAALCGLFLLVKTAADLEQKPQRNQARRGARLGAQELALGIGLWWMPLLGSLVWANAGNQPLTAALSQGQGVLAATGMVGLASIVSHFQSDKTTGSRWGLPNSGYPWILFCCGVIVLALTALASTGLVLQGPIWGAAQTRMHEAILPIRVWPILGLAMIPLQEAYFRGRLVAKLGSLGSIIAFIVIATPLDPIFGLITGTVLVLVNRNMNAGFWPGTTIRVLIAIAMLANLLP